MGCSAARTLHAFVTAFVRTPSHCGVCTYATSLYGPHCMLSQVAKAAARAAEAAAAAAARWIAEYRRRVEAAAQRQLEEAARRKEEERRRLEQQEEEEEARRNARDARTQVCPTAAK